MTKITAIESGGDWADASVNYLILPDGMIFEEQLRHYRQVGQSGEEAFVPLTAWLIRRGARAPTDGELEIVSDD